MIFDENLLFGKSATISGGTGTVNIGDVLDLGTNVRKAPNQMPIRAAIEIVTDIAPSGVSLQFQIVSDSGSAIATDGSQTVHAVSATFTAAQLTKGEVVGLVLPPSPKFEQYVGLQAIIYGVAATGGAVYAGLMLDVQDWESLPDAL